MTSGCYNKLGVNQKITLILSNARELDRIPITS